MKPHDGSWGAPDGFERVVWFLLEITTGARKGAFFLATPLRAIRLYGYPASWLGGSELHPGSGRIAVDPYSRLAFFIFVQSDDSALHKSSPRGASP